MPRPDASAGPRTFNLEQTLRASLAASSALQTARRNVQIDEKRADAIAAQNRFNLSGDARATRYDAATQIQFGDGPPVTVLPEHTEALSLVASQRLDFLGQIRAATRQAELQTLADRFVLGQIASSRALQAKTVYYDLLRADHQVQVAEAALRAAQAQQQIAQRLYEGQIGPKIDLLRANTQVAQAEQDRLRAQNNRDIARANFNDLVGRPLDAPVAVEDVPGATVGTDVTAPAAAPVGAPAPQAFTPFAAPVAEVGALNLDQSVETAQRQRPEALQDEVRVRVAETGVRLARVGQEPSFALSASGNYYPTTSFQFPRQRTAAITASISIPLYDGGATRDRIAEARLQTENARTTLEGTRTDIALDVRQAFLNLQTTARQIEAANTALEQAVAARQLAQIRYEGQVGLYLEVTDAQAALVRAQNGQVDAVYNYLIARARFENALGTPQTLPETAPAVPAVPAPGR